MAVTTAPGGKTVGRILLAGTLLVVGCPDFVEGSGSDDGSSTGNDTGVTTGAACGNGIVEAGEECDDGPLNSGSVRDACRPGCVLASCGDGVADSDEACDDGPLNGSPDSTCTEACVSETCGDGVIDENEECDDGADNNDEMPGTCRTSCLLPYCGDGVVDDNEGCDDGDDNSDENADACRTDCDPARCGDGVVDDGEMCDLGKDNGSGECPRGCGANLGACGLDAARTLLTEGGFEFLTLATSPTDLGYWGGDLASSTMAEDRIAPAEGRFMLRFDATNDSGGGGDGSSSDVHQLVAAQAQDEGATVRAGVLCNRVSGNSNTDTEFILHLRVFEGPAWQFPERLSSNSELLEVEDSVEVPAEQWTELCTELTVPALPSGGYYAFTISAVENVDDDGPPDEFDGHYCDAAVLAFE